AERELELALEDVEPVRVPVVDMRVRPLLARRVAEPCHRQLLAVDEDAQRPALLVEDRLALARALQERFDHAPTISRSAPCAQSRRFGLKTSKRVTAPRQT